jgi:hypothetical protein
MSLVCIRENSSLLHVIISSDTRVCVNSLVLAIPYKYMNAAYMCGSSRNIALRVVCKSIIKLSVFTHSLHDLH